MGGGGGKAYANALHNKMDNNNDAITSAACASCTLHDNDHPPIIDCDSVLEPIFGMEGIIDCNVETSTYSAFCNAGIVHHHAGQLGNGHIEGQLVGYVPVMSDNLADVNISLGISRKMAIITSLTLTSTP